MWAGIGAVIDEWLELIIMDYTLNLVDANMGPKMVPEPID